MSQTSLSAYLSQANIYEVNLRQYTPEGTIRAFISHIPRLAAMGVQVLWIMPVFPIGEINRKGTLGSYYSIKDFCDVNPEFGTKEDFQALVDTVHAHGMKIIMDWVANHAAWDNAWTSTHPEFFARDEAGKFISPYDWTDVIQLDHSNDQQQSAMLDAMTYWLITFDIDGFRADLAHLTPLPFWRNARIALDKLKPGLIWLAESEELTYFEAFDINYAWNWMHTSQEFINSNSDISTLIHFLEQQRIALPHNAFQLYFTSNHDENSWNGTEYEKYGDNAKALAVFSFTYPGAVPLIYTGQEIPNYRRLAFFEKDDAGFSAGQQLQDFYSRLAGFRKKGLIPGTCNFLQPIGRVLAYHMGSNENDVLVFLNIGKEPTQGSFKHQARLGEYHNVFTDETFVVNNEINIQLEAGGYLLLYK